MPLSEQNRSRLDGIVSQMVSNNERDQNIQFVVDDFKQKYGDYQQPGQRTISPEDQARADKLRADANEMSRDWDKTISEAQKQSFKSQPLDARVLSGIGKTLYSTPGIKQLYDVGSKILPGDFPSTPKPFDAYERATEGDIAAGTGEVLGDLALTALPVAKGARLGKLGKTGLQKATLGGLGAGLASTAVHQAQNLQTKGKLDPIGGAVETGLSTALPGAGAGAGKILKSAAPGMLRSAVKPVRKFMDSRNPPNFTKPLEDKLITAFGGLEEGIYKTGKAVKKLAKKRDDLISSQNIKVNITDVTRKVGKKLNEMVGKEIEVDDALKAFKYAKNAKETAKKLNKKSSGKLSKDGIKKTYKEQENELFNKAMQEEKRKLAKENLKAMAESSSNSGIINRMATFVKAHGHRKNKTTGMLNSERIPKQKFGQSSDEIATDLGISESEFMEMLTNISSSKKSKINDLGYPAEWDDVGSNIVKNKAEKLSVSGEKAVELRKLADKKSKFNPFSGAVNDPDKVVFNEAYRRVLEDEIEDLILKKGGEAVKIQYKALKKEMADLIPFQKAGEFRLGQQGNNYQFSLMDMGAMGVAGSLGGLPAAAAGGVVRRLTQTPGGASILYNTGRKLAKPGLKRNAVMQLGRSTYDKNRQ